MNAIEVEELNVWVNGRHILKDISFKLPEHKILAILGPSGSGKTTLLKTLNRLIELYPNVKVKGSVRILGVNVYSPKTNPYQVRRIIGMVFQQPNPFPNLSIYENIALGPKYNGLVKGKRELDHLVRECLVKANLWDEVKDRLFDSPLNLSGGQQQRLCLARALANKPKILLLDEPTANIDPLSARKIEETILKLKSEMTIILVTHSPKQALRVADYIAVMYEGRLIEYCLKEEITSRRLHPIASKILFEP